MSDNGRSSWLPMALLAATGLVAGGALVRGLDSGRPATAPVPPPASFDGMRVAARLWQDPLAAAWRDLDDRVARSDPTLEWIYRPTDHPAAAVSTPSAARSGASAPGAGPSAADRSAPGIASTGSVDSSTSRATPAGSVQRMAAALQGTLDAGPRPTDAHEHAAVSEEEHPGETSPQPASGEHAHEPSASTLVLAVMASGSRDPSATENRRRYRYAVTQGLAQYRLYPNRTEDLDYFVYDAGTGWTAGATPVPYEWFGVEAGDHARDKDALTHRATADDPGHGAESGLQRALVLWLDERSFGDLAAIRVLLEELLPSAAATEAVEEGRIALSLIGPTGSVALSTWASSIGLDQQGARLQSATDPGATTSRRARVDAKYRRLREGRLPIALIGRDPDEPSYSAAAIADVVPVSWSSPDRRRVVEIVAPDDSAARLREESAARLREELEAFTGLFNPSSAPRGAIGRAERAPARGPQPSGSPGGSARDEVRAAIDALRGILPMEPPATKPRVPVPARTPDIRVRPLERIPVQINRIVTGLASLDISPGPREALTVHLRRMQTAAYRAAERTVRPGTDLRTALERRRRAARLVELIDERSGPVRPLLPGTGEVDLVARIAALDAAAGAASGPAPSNPDHDTAVSELLTAFGVDLSLPASMPDASENVPVVGLLVSRWRTVNQVEDARGVPGRAVARVTDLEFNPLDRLRIYSPMATANIGRTPMSGEAGETYLDSVMTRLGHALRTTPNGTGSMQRVAALDAEVVRMLLRELELRSVRIAGVDDPPGAALTHRGPGLDHLVIVHERDTFFGRDIPNAFRREILTTLESTIDAYHADDEPTPEDRAAMRLLERLVHQRGGGTSTPAARLADRSDADPEIMRARVEAIVRETVHTVAYLRGMDGRLGDSGGGGREQAVRGEGSDLAPSQRSEGPGQFDYLRRIVDQVRSIEQSLTQSGHDRIRAIGIIGIDVYDKLLVLQALKREFPDAVFFTTDMDARLLDGRQRSLTRNLVVGSGAGLRWHPSIQRDVPPFRGVYQANHYLATLLAVGDRVPEADRLPVARTGSGGDARLASNLLVGGDVFRPRIFEIGRHGPIDLSPPSRPGVIDRDVDFGDALQTWVPLRAQEASVELHPITDPRFTWTRFWIWSSLVVVITVLAGIASSRVRRAIRDHVRAIGNAPWRVLRVAAAATTLGLVTALSISGAFGPVSRWITVAALAVLAVVAVQGEGRHFIGRLLGRSLGLSPSVSRRRRELLLALPATFGLVVAGLSAVILINANIEGGLGEGEPVSLLSGVSIWPTELLRATIGLICVIGIVRTLRLLVRRDDELVRRYRLPSIAAARAIPALSDGVEASIDEQWGVYARDRRAIHLGVRIALTSSAIIVATFLFRSMYAVPIPPARGDIAMAVSVFGGFATMLLLTILISVVTVVVRLDARLADRLGDVRTDWGPVLSRVRRDRDRDGDGVLDDELAGDRFAPWIDFHDRLASEALDVRLIVDRTNASSSLLMYPFVALAGLVVARNDLFDDWDWTPFTVGFYAVLALYTLATAIKLRRSAEASRRSALERLHILETQIVGHRGRPAAESTASAAGAPSPEPSPAASSDASAALVASVHDLVQAIRGEAETAPGPGESASEAGDPAGRGSRDRADAPAAKIDGDEGDESTSASASASASAVAVVPGPEGLSSAPVEDPAVAVPRRTTLPVPSEIDSRQLAHVRSTISDLQEGAYQAWSNRPLVQTLVPFIGASLVGAVELLRVFGL